MFRWVVFAVAVVVLCSDAEGRRRDPGNRRRGPKVDSRELDIALEELRNEVAALKAQIDGVPSVGAVDAASASCNAEKVHIHFDHDDAEEEHSSPDDTHVHINLKIDPPSFGHPGMMRGMMKNVMGGNYAPEEHSAHCEMEDISGSGITGHLHFVQMDDALTASVHVDMENFPEANQFHAMHVHQFGDFGSKCSSLGGHYDPNKDDKVDDGDLGGITTNAVGAVKDQVIDKTRVTLFGPNSILGRSVIIHDKDGNRMTCCLIGYAKENPEHSHPFPHFMHRMHAAHAAHGVRSPHGHDHDDHDDHDDHKHME